MKKNNVTNKKTEYFRLMAKRAVMFFIFVCAALRPALSNDHTLLGVDVLQKQGFRPLRGAKVGLITNHTGLNRAMLSTVDLLHKSKHVTLVCVMSPEHGFRGTADHGEKVADMIDDKTGVPVFSLYGKTTRPTDEMLKGVDTIVFDIQDVGTRFYTYITTMAMAMEEAARRNLRFVVLDRPNPIRGDIVEGDVLDDATRRMTGYFPLPVRHGLTVGEIAMWINEIRQINADVSVVWMKNWHRELWFEDTGLVFTPPSPNIRTLTAALLYPGIGAFEATNVSVGRGTDMPFEVFGAPWIQGRALTAYLRSLAFPGVLFEVETFTPKHDLYKGIECQGVRVLVTHREKIRPFDVFVHAFLYLTNHHAADFKPVWEEVRIVTGSDKLKDAAHGKISIEQLLSDMQENQDTFIQNMASYFQY